jgi:hypothetical protein
MPYRLRERPGLCDRCRGPLKISTKLVPGAVVVGCKACRRMRLEDDTLWLEGDRAAIAPKLRARADQLAEDARYREFISSYDERWTVFHT